MEAIIHENIQKKNLSWYYGSTVVVSEKSYL